MSDLPPTPAPPGPYSPSEEEEIHVMAELARAWIIAQYGAGA